MHAYAPGSVWRFDTENTFFSLHTSLVCQPARGVVCARTRWANWPWSCFIFSSGSGTDASDKRMRADWFNKAQANFAEERFMNGNVFRALENYSLHATLSSVCALVKNSTLQCCNLFLRC
jgi:hypothetical protein